MTLRIFACILIFIIIVIAAIMNINNNVVSESSIDLNKDILNNLESKNVSCIILEPYIKTNTIINKQLILKDKLIINNVVSSYRNMRKERSGDGKLDGDWQIKLIILMNDSSKIESLIFHNKQTNLIFIPNRIKKNYLNLDDFFANKEISDIIIEAIRTQDAMHK